MQDRNSAFNYTDSQRNLPNWSHKYSVDVLNSGLNYFCFVHSITDLSSILLLSLTKMLKRLWFPWLYLGTILSGSVCCLHGRGSIYSALTCECIDPKTADWLTVWMKVLFRNDHYTIWNWIFCELFALTFPWHEWNFLWNVNIWRYLFYLHFALFCCVTRITEAQLIFVIFCHLPFILHVPFLYFSCSK